MTQQTDAQNALRLYQSGQPKAALKASKAGLRNYRNSPVFANIAGIASCALGQHRDGVDYFQKALKIDPGFAEARRNLAQTLILLGKPDQAETLMARRVSSTPADADAWYILAQARVQMGQPDAAFAATETAITQTGPHPRLHVLRARIHEQRGALPAAIAEYEAALALNPDHVDTLINIRMPLSRQGRFGEAQAHARRAVLLAPGHIGARLGLAAQLVQAGDTDGARAQYRAVLEQDAGNSEAIEQLAQLQSRTENQALLPAAQAALRKAGRRSQDRANLSFALSRIEDQIGNPDAAARHLAEANAVMAGLTPYDPDTDARLHQTIAARFDAAPAALADPDPDAARPIFVVGLPRSGTTLAEAILGAHPQVQPLGERAAAGILLGPIITQGAGFDAQQAQAFVHQDRAMLPDLLPGTRAYVDKMPENYRLIGFLKAAYPDCRIINLQRDPRDTGLSNWRAHFSGTALSYVHDLNGMAHHFNLYAQLMRHWRALFPDQILDVRYEDMVADVTGTGQAMADFCGLDWVPQMARPDLAADQVLTLSATQLRQPVHGRSVGGWRQHETMLAPFITGLDPALWPDLA